VTPQGPLGTQALRPAGPAARYQKRVSGPLLDPLRVDTLSDIEVPRVDYNKLTDDRLGEPSEVVRARVEAARERQRTRFSGTDIAANADT
jgi:magnesium chelatase family protein